MLAPWFGNSLYTWTGLIGVLLISLSAGYYLGGRLADRWPDYALLAHLLTAAALVTMLVPALQTAMEASLSAAGVIGGPIVATGLLLGIPACLLAAVSPFTVKLLSLLSADRKVGLSAGAIGMAATLGSVVGTFSSGFVLIPHLGLRTIFFGVGAVLGLLAVAGYLLFSPSLRRSKTAALIVAAAFALAAVGALRKKELPETIVYEQTTFYHRIRVIEAPTRAGDRVRRLFLDNSSEGAQLVQSREVPVDYQQSWEFSRVFFSKLSRAAFLGGGAFTMPEALLDAFPGSEADVAEIDPAVIGVGRRYFRVGEYPRLHPVAEDAAAVPPRGLAALRADRGRRLPRSPLDPART